MGKEWKDPQIPHGSVAKGKYYYPRNEIVEQIWNELEKGNSVLIDAPRRMGKTSVLQFMQDNQKEIYKLIFNDVEAIDSADKFYEKIYTLLVNCLNKMDKIKQWFKKYKSSKSITEITLEGLKFENKPADFLELTNDLLSEINNNQEIEKIVLLIDELPGMLFNINKTNNKGAVSILKNLRYWRQQPEMSKKVNFVLAGSVGIHYVVKAIEGRVAIINDLTIIDFPPFSDVEAFKYIDWATKTATVKYNKKLKEYMVNKISYCVPFFINIMLGKINIEAKKNNNPSISTEDIDNAFDIVLKNSKDFDDWKNRLEKYMHGEDFDFVNEILTHIAHKDKISINEIYDKALKHNKKNNYMDFIDDLKKDGYIIESDDNYTFISPFLSAFWKRKNSD